MKKLGLASIGILLTAGIIVSLMIHRRAEAGLTERREAFARQAVQVEEMAAANARLSAIVAAQPDAVSTPEAVGQLLRLRSEVGQLRKLSGEQARLRAVTQHVSTRESKAQHHLAEAQMAANYWPKEQLSFAGYADPESAMRSMLWMLHSGQMDSWQAICTPEAKAQLERQWEKRGLSQAARDAELKLMADFLMSRSSGFHIVEQKATAPEETVIQLSFDGEDRVRKFVLRKGGNEWKFHNLLLSGQGGAD
jgi:hypothetical protein